MCPFSVCPLPTSSCRAARGPARDVHDKIHRTMLSMSHKKKQAYAITHTHTQTHQAPLRLNLTLQGRRPQAAESNSDPYCPKQRRQRWTCRRLHASREASHLFHTLQEAQDKRRTIFLQQKYKALHISSRLALPQPASICPLANPNHFALSVPPCPAPLVSMLWH